MAVQRLTPNKCTVVLKQRGWRDQFVTVLALLLTLMAGQPASAVNGDLDESQQNALLLTQILESEGDLAHPPEFSAKDRTVYAVIDGTPTEARERCLLIESLVEKYDLVFAKGWTAEVTTEDADGEAMASCPL